MFYYTYYTYSPDAYKQAPAFRRYRIQEKTFSVGDNFKIKDDSGRDVYKVRSKLLSFGDKLVLEDMAGNGLVKIRQETMHFHPTFNILSARAGDADRPLATIKKKFAFFHNRFEIDSVYGPYTLEGLEVFSRSFTLTKNGQTAAKVSKKYLAFSDSYDVDVAGTEDPTFILSLVIVLDQVLFDQHGSNG